MTTRTFKQYGIAFGPQTANITAKIDDVVVYQGPVETLNELRPALPIEGYTVENAMFSWTTDVAFTGPQVLEITVDSGNADLLVAQIRANYTQVVIEPGNVVSSGPDNYVTFPSTQFGNTYVNGTLQEVVHGDWTGMWWWWVPTSGTFVENFTATPGQE